MFKLNNKNIIVTGASQGIGMEIACSIASLGANVYLIGRNKKKLKQLEGLLQTQHASQTFKSYIIDISSENDVNIGFNDIINDSDSIDVLINNAGITSDQILLKMKTKAWNDVINTNLTGTFQCSKAVIKTMLKQKYGKIINIGSIIGVIGNPGQTNYSASKAGITGFSKSLAKELGSRNITVNVVNPGYIHTKMTEELTEKKADDYLKKIPLNRFGKTKDVADLVCFLCSERSNYITGQIINIDGGITI